MAEAVKPAQQVQAKPAQQTAQQVQAKPVQQTAQQTQAKPVQQVQTKTVQQTQTDDVKQGKEVYTVAEYEAGAKKLFGVRPYTVRAAFLKANKTEASLDEAKALVKAFAEKKVN